METNRKPGKKALLDNWDNSPTKPLPSQEMTVLSEPVRVDAISPGTAHTQAVAANIVSVLDKYSKGDRAARLDTSDFPNESVAMGSAINDFIDFVESNTQNAEQSSMDLALDLSMAFDVMHELSQGNFSVKLAAQMNNEFTADFAQNLDRMIQDVAKFIFHVKSLTKEVSTSATEITTSIEEVSSQVQDSYTQIADMSAATIELSTAAKSVAENADNTFSKAVQAVESAKQGGTSAAQMIEGMEKINASVSATSRNITALGESSKEIGNILKVISDIASQTDMLAINAAIEAARAGEHGKGFGVVADEVRKLAERSAKAANQINSLIIKIRSDTEHAVLSMKDVLSETSNGTLLMKETGKILQTIILNIEDAQSSVDHISKITTDQVEASTNVASGMELTQSSTDLTAKSSREMAAASHELASLAQELQSQVEVFKIPEDQA
jgi:methyl-accepting chemotaxis protein